MISERLFRRYYPDNSLSGTIRFYDWIREGLDPSMRVLNLGAGPPTKDRIRILKGEAAEVVGADPDPVVLQNAELDSAVVLSDRRLPFPDCTFHLVFSDFVLEHVEQPRVFLSETLRVLRPGGDFFFRTPNCFHYVPMISKMTPHWFHTLVANRARGLGKDAHEPWPTFYRMNSRGRLKTLAQEAGFHSVQFRMIEAEPMYLLFHPLPFMCGVAWERIVNSTEWLAGLRANILGRFTR